MIMTRGLSTVSMGLDHDDVGSTKVSFEDAMESTGFGKFNRLSLLFCGFMLLGVILETLGFSFVIPACQCDLELDLTAKSVLPIIPFIAIILTSHIWGYLADTKGRKKILAFSMAVGSFFSVLSSFSPDLVTFAALRFIAGLFNAGPSAIGYAYLGELNPKSQRDKMLTLGNASVAFGTAVVPMLAWAVLPTDFRFHMIYIDYRPWRLLICLFALPYIICCLAITKLPSSPRFLHSRGDEEETLEVLQYIYSVNTGRKPSEYPVTQLKIHPRSSEAKRPFFKDVWHQTAPLLGPKYRFYLLITCLLQFGVFAASNGFLIWFPAILTNVLDHKDEGTDLGENICTMLGATSVQPTENSTVISTAIITECNDTLNTGTFPISIILSSIVSLITVISAFTITCLGKRNMLVGFFVVTATCCLVLHWITDTWFAIAVFATVQIGGTSIGLINAYVVEIFPTHVRAMAVCLTLMIGRVGSMFGTNMIGYLIHTVCPVSFFLFSGILYFLAALVFTLPVSDDNKRKKSSSEKPPPYENRTEL